MLGATRVERAVRLPRKQKAGEGSIALPGSVGACFRYGIETVAPSPTAEMLNVPAAVPAANA